MPSKKVKGMEVQLGIWNILKQKGTHLNCGSNQISKVNTFSCPRLTGFYK